MKIVFWLVGMLIFYLFSTKRKREDMNHIVDAEKIRYNGEIRIRLHFSFCRDTLRMIRDLPGIRWSPMMQSWHIKAMPEFTKHLNNLYDGKLLFRDIIPKSVLRDFYEEEPERMIRITHYRGNHELSLKFFYDPKPVQLIKSLDHSRFDPVAREWFMEISKENNSSVP